MADAPNFTKLVPGFDFLQELVKNAGSALPSMGQWVAPTLDPDELQKRIDELRTVQFWLDQNAKMLGTTVQALEVQRMTLSTLKTMNVQMTDLRDAMKMPQASGFGADALMQAAKTAMSGVGAFARPAAPGDAGAKAPAAPAPEAPTAEEAVEKIRAEGDGGQPPVPATGLVDPMQWWNALTRQFTQLAANAMKDPSADAAKNFAGTMMQQGLDAAGDTLKKAVSMPAEVAQQAMSAATRAATGAGGAKPAARKTAARKPAAKTRAAPAKTRGR